MHNNFISERAILIFALILFTITSCTDAKKNYIIAVSQCSEDSWRQKLKQELEMATFSMKEWNCASHLQMMTATFRRDR